MSLALLAGGAAIFGSIAQGFVADYAQNKQAKEQARAQANALRQQAGIYSQQASIYSQQGGIYSDMAKASMVGAGMYSSQGRTYAAAAAKAAEAGIRRGRSNARILRLAAASLDPYEQLALRNATVEARRRVGAGRAQFAANGVMVDSGSAALWEQDEAADAALERLDIMQQFEDRSWEYRTQANRVLAEATAEGYAQAAGYAAQAASQEGSAMGAVGAAMGNVGSAIGSVNSAYAQNLQASAALSQASQTSAKNHWYNTIGSAFGVLGGIGMAKAFG